MKVYISITGIPHGVCVQWTPPVMVAVYLYRWDLNNLCCWDSKGNGTLYILTEFAWCNRVFAFLQDVFHPHAGKI